MCKEIGVKLENSDWDYHIPKLVDTSLELKVNMLDGINNWKPKETTLTINRAS
jgi:hypothetical protein